MDNQYRHYENRDLSWLKFNQRCLEEAEDPGNPLFERLFFMSIWQTNLDEFFMVRVGGIHDRLLFNKNITDNKSGMTDSQQLSAIHDALAKLLKRVDRSYNRLIKECRSIGLTQVRFNAVSKYQLSFLERYFEREILPFLSPAVIDSKHAFPFLENNALYLGTVMHRRNGRNLLGIVPIRQAFPRMVMLPSQNHKFILTEDLIYLFAEKIFDKYKIKEKSIFRITRNADLDAEEALEGHEKLDFRKSMEVLLKKRKRLAPVRIEFYAGETDNLEELVTKNLKLNKDHTYVRRIPLSLSFFSELRKLYKEDPTLFFPKVSPQHTPFLSQNQPVIPQLRKKDLLLSYPYESIKTFISLLNEAAADPDVTSIYITLYREADNSRIVDALAVAGENGKDVLALVELRARFDEYHNIDVSKQLEDAGVKVIYGLEDYKVHSKLLLITFIKDGKTEYITQIGTGNYNEATANLYSDLTYITAGHATGLNALEVFSALKDQRLVEHSDILLVAPLGLKPRILELIEEQIAVSESGGEGRLIFKLNSLSDVDIIDALVRASRAGVKIDLIIRGICCLKAGSKAARNITVRSIIGRYLEHARVYMFGQKENRQIFISSADFMTRNTQRRVEVAAPIRDEGARKYIEFYIETQLLDNVKSRIQTGGIYKKVEPAPGEKPLSSQNEFIKYAYLQAGKESPEL
jgi:polyphosphate kinase